MAHFNITYTQRSVNSKRLRDRLVTQVADTAPEFIRLRNTIMSATYDFSQFVDYIDLFMEQMIEEKEIIAFDLMGDLRNNSMYEIGEGHLNLHLEYQQYNCLNITKLDFFIQRV